MNYLMAIKSKSILEFMASIKQHSNIASALYCYLEFFLVVTR